MPATRPLAVDYRCVGGAGRSRYKPILCNTVNPANANLGAPIPWINNEELILLRAEISWNTNDKQGAIDDVNLIRVNAGGLFRASRERRAMSGRQGR